MIQNNLWNYVHKLGDNYGTDTTNCQYDWHTTPLSVSMEHGRLVRVHALRHTHATVLHESGGNLNVTQDSMRHSSLEMTLNYTHKKLPAIAIGSVRHGGWRTSSLTSDGVIYERIIDLFGTV